MKNPCHMNSDTSLFPWNCSPTNYWYLELTFLSVLLLKLSCQIYSVLDLSNILTFESVAFSAELCYLQVCPERYIQILFLRSSPHIILYHFHGTLNTSFYKYYFFIDAANRTTIYIKWLLALLSPLMLVNIFDRACLSIFSAVF